jgi:hypothetical protein
MVFSDMKVPVLSAGLKKIGLEVGVGLTFKVPVVSYSATSVMSKSSSILLLVIIFK